MGNYNPEEGDIMKAFTEYKIKNLTLRNRIVMPPMCMYSTDESGFVKDFHKVHYTARAIGGVGLIIVEATAVVPNGRITSNDLGIWSDAHIEGLKSLVESVKSYGSKIAIQLAHAGRKCTSNDEYIVAPSPIRFSEEYRIPKELTVDEIKEIVNKFKEAAIRVKKAGFDGVEIHSAHGFLLNQFLSPLTNKRTDEYGGNIYGRIKIHLEIIREIKKALGEDYPLLLRLGATDKTEGGITIEDSIKAALEFEKAGVDILDISGGFCGYALPGQAYFAPISEEIKKAVKVPVIVTGGIKDPYLAEKVLREGKADLIGVGRAILNDSSWAKKAVESFV